MSLTLITGASSGLGAEFATLCATKRHDLILVARSKDTLEAIKTELEAKHQITVKVLAVDLSKPDAAKQVADAAGPVDILINNAGFGSYGTFAEIDLQHEHDMIVVNVLALTELTKLLLPGMLAKKSGRILNVASTAAYQPGPLMAVYYATKAYVLSFSHAIRQEVHSKGITVTCLSPGPTATGFEKTAKLGASKLFRNNLMDARTVAHIGLEACLKGKAEVIPGLRNKIGAFATRFAPRPLAAKVVKFVQGKV